MPRINLVVLAVLVLLLAACTRGSGEDAGADHAEPAHVEEVEEGTIPYVVLTARASERIGVKTAPVTREPGGAGTVVPYAALIYDAEGGTWAYTNPEPLTFMREAVTVAQVEGDRAVLMHGPEVGTQVVMVGVAELYGTEFGVGH